MTAAAATALAISIAITPSAATPRHASKAVSTVTLTTGISGRYDAISVLAGSSSQLIYGLNDAPADTPQVGVQPDEVFARNSSGGTVELASAPEYVDWSANGDFVSARRADGYVEMWGLGDNRQDVNLILPSGATYMGAGKGGVIYSDGGDLRLIDPTGTTSDLGTPFPAGEYFHVVTSDFGYLADDAATNDLEYATWGHPGDFSKVDTSGISTDGISCQAINATNAACTVNDFHPFLLPLTGGEPTVVGTCGDRVALAGSTLLWTGGTQGWCPKPDQLNSATQGSTDVVAREQIRPAINTAYGEAVGVTLDGSRLFAATDAGHLTTLLTPPHPPERAATLALGRSRVVYVSDRSNSQNTNLSLLSRTIRRNGDQLRPSAPTRLSPRSDSPLTRYPPALAGHVTAYVGDDNSPTFPPDSINIVAQDGIQKLRNLATSDTAVSVSRQWVAVSGRPHAGITAINVKTHKRIRIRDVARFAKAAVSGHHLYYFDSAYRVQQLNLRTHARRLVFDPEYRHSPGFPVVFASGHWVAWNMGTPGPATFVGMRDVRDSGRPILLSHNLYALSPHGALTADPVAVPGDLRTGTWITDFHGHTHQLREPDVYQATPVVSHDLIAWITEDGQLEVAPYPLTGAASSRR